MSGGGRDVTLESTVDIGADDPVAVLFAVADKAYALWAKTGDGVDRRDGPAVGFQAEQTTGADLVGIGDLRKGRLYVE